MTKFPIRFTDGMPSKPPTSEHHRLHPDGPLKKAVRHSTGILVTGTLVQQLASDIVRHWDYLMLHLKSCT